MFSLKAYREFFQECDRRIVAGFEYSIMHTHSANAKLVTGLLEIPELAAIQVLLDPTGPSVAQMLPLFERVQDSGKALLITHELSDDALTPLLSKLSPRGLALERMVSENQKEVSA